MAVGSVLQAGLIGSQSQGISDAQRVALERIKVIREQGAAEETGFNQKGFAEEINRVAEISGIEDGSIRLDETERGQILDIKV